MTIRSVQNNDINGLRRAFQSDKKLAVLGRTSDPSSEVFVNGRPGYWWVRQMQAGGTFGPPQQVRGCTIPMQTTPGTPVYLIYEEGEWAVGGPDFIGLVSQGVNPTQAAVVDPNANNPSFVNQAFISTAYEQIVEGTLKVAVRGSVPLVAGVFVKVEGQIDFTGNVPTTGEHCVAVTAVLSDLSDFETQYSTPKSTLIPLDLDDLNEAWALMSDPLTNKPLWSWDIGNGQTALIEKNRWMDNRQFWDIDTTSGGSGTVTSVAWTPNDGVSASIATATTTPNITPDLTDITPDSVKVIATGGAGYYENVAQSSDPAAPAATGLRLFADASGYLAWRVKNGSDTFKRLFNGVLTAARTYTWPDKSGTVAMTSDIPAAGITQLTGDVTAGPGSGSQAATLATVNSNVGSFTLASITVNAKGLITAAATGLVNLATQVSGLLGLANGGTHADLSATGPGVLVQASSGADVTVPAALSIGYLADAFKLMAEISSTTNISVSSAPGTIDGLSPSTGQRVFLKGQTAGAENGLWTYNGSGSALTRPTDFASGSTLFAYRGIVVYVRNGNTGSRKFWYLLTTGTVTIDTTSQQWLELEFTANQIIGGLLGVNVGGTGAALSATGPGLIQQTSSGAALSSLAPGAAGHYPRSNGTNYVDAAFQAGDIASGQVALARGGSGADLSATGPGVLIQATNGANVTVTAKYRKPLFDHFTNAASTATSSEEDLYTDTLAAGQFGTNGDKAFVWYAVTYATTARAKRLRAYVAGTVVFDTGAVGSGNAVIVNLSFMVIRVDATTLRVIAGMGPTLVAGSQTYTEITGLTLSNTQIIKITSTIASGAANDMVARMGAIEFEGAA